MIATCNELRIVNIHANATVSSFIASSPNTQVQPSKGRIITAAFTNALCRQKMQSLKQSRINLCHKFN